MLLFYPDMTQTPPVNVAWAIATQRRGAATTSAGGGNGVVVGTGGAGFTFTFTGVPVGPRVILADQAPTVGTNQVVLYIRVPTNGLNCPYR